MHFCYVIYCASCYDSALVTILMDSTNQPGVLGSVIVQ